MLLWALAWLKWFLITGPLAFVVQVAAGLERPASLALWFAAGALASVLASDEQEPS